MPQAALIGQLTFSVQSKQFIEIPKGKQIVKNCGTTSWVYCIQGELSGDCAGSESFHIDISVQQSVHRFHNETWNFFTFCNIWNESIGTEGERLVGSGRGHHPEWCEIHSKCPDPKKNKWVYDVSEDMKHFELALFDRQGRWTKNTCPLDYDIHSIGVHPTAAVVFAPNKGFRAILEAVVTTCNLLGTCPRYWKYTGETTPYHWKDGGLCLTDEGRWRSDSCLWFVKKYGWEHVPESIYEEMRSMVDALPEDQPQSSGPPPKTDWTERAPIQRKRQHEQPSTIITPEPQRAKPAEPKPVLQAVTTPVEQRPTERTLTEQRTTGRTPHDDIRHRLFSDSMQRQLFARHVPQRPWKASQGTPSGLGTAPAADPHRTVFVSAIDTKAQPNRAAAVVDLTTGADDATQQEGTGEPSASNPCGGTLVGNYSPYAVN